MKLGPAHTPPLHLLSAREGRPRDRPNLTQLIHSPIPPPILHVEYAERGKEYGILFIFSLSYEYIHLEYIRIHVIYRVIQAEYAIHILVVAPPEYVNVYSTRSPPPTQRERGATA